MHSRWLWIFIPFTLGIVFSLIIVFSSSSNPILYAQIDLATLIFCLGVSLSILVGILLFVFDWVENYKDATMFQSAEDRRRFLQRLDHELKNPLTAIFAGLANISLSEMAETNSVTLDSIQAQVGRVRHLVAELRKLSELETRPLESEKIDMTELMEDAFSIMESHYLAKERKLSLSIPRAPWPLPSINGDRDLLILAIHNLLDNAIKFSQPGDTIEIRAFEDGNNVIVEVADTGPGIPEQEQTHVWEELYRGEGARGIPGSGLGLALVRAILAKHNGNITLRSRYGEVSVFVVRLPC
jgi:two-component system OmpR family sensor kinase